MEHFEQSTMPLTQIERPISRNGAGVTGFVATAFLLALIGSTSFIAGLMYFQPLLMGVSFASVFAGWMLIDRRRQHDQLSTVKRIITPAPAPQPAKVDEVAIQPEIVRSSGGANQIVYGKYSFTHDQWKSLSRVLFANNDRFVRDIVASANVFESITRNWTDIYNEFERLGLVSDRQLTADGIAFFSRFSPYPNR